MAGVNRVTSITSTNEFTGSISWSPNQNPFNAGTVYTTTITLTPLFGYTFSGVSANYFTVAAANSVTNLVNSNIVTAVSPTT